jgi:hypothetical protein
VEPDGEGGLFISTTSASKLGSARHFLIAEMRFYYTYILQSEKAPDRYYIGFTEELESRLKAHNSGKVPHSAKHRPFRGILEKPFRSRFRQETTLRHPSLDRFAHELWMAGQEFAERTSEGWCPP